jgi:hypothetical protein
MLNQADGCAVYMGRELGFEWLDLWDLQFSRPFVLWPHLEARNREPTPKMLAVLKGSPYHKYSPADIALLDDPVKREIYMEAHVGCMAPRWREVAMILSTKSALMEPPSPVYVDGLFPNGMADWTKFSGGSLSYHMFDMAVFAYAWAPLERRWQAGGALHGSRILEPKSIFFFIWTKSRRLKHRVHFLVADFSRMQPVQPNPWLIIVWIFDKMIGAAGLKEKELQGSSSAIHVNAAGVGAATAVYTDGVAQDDT